MVNSGAFVRYLEAGGMAVDVHVLQDHLGVRTHTLSAVGAQVFLQHSPGQEEQDIDIGGRSLMYCL